MIRILHVVPSFDMNEMGTDLLRLIASTRGGDYLHAVVALHPEGVLRRRFQEAHVELVTFDFGAAPLSQFIELLGLIRRTRPDIVQTWLYDADIYGGLAARMAGNRNVIWGVESTGLEPRAHTVDMLVRRACAMLSRWVPHTIVCVAETARRKHVECGFDPDRMVVVVNGISQDSMPNAPGQGSTQHGLHGNAPERPSVQCDGTYVSGDCMRIGFENLYAHVSGANGHSTRPIRRSSRDTDIPGDEP